MVKIVQFGEGNFLRTFADAYFDALNEEGDGPYAVNVVKPIPHAVRCGKRRSKAGKRKDGCRNLGAGRNRSNIALWNC